MPPNSPELTIVVPAFNEAARLVERAARLIEAVRSGAIDAESTELILVDDGSTDGTAEVATGVLSPDFPHMRIVRLLENSGKGAAVRAGAAAASAPIVVFMDADMAVDPSDLPLLMTAMQHSDVAIGSRSIDGATVHNGTFQRIIMGRTFNRFVNALTNVGIKDTQCGFKAFRTPVARILFHLMVVDRFAFDVEVLCLAQRLGLSISEVPVQWHSIDGSKVRHVTDSFSMALDVARLRLRRDRPAIPALVVSAGSQFEAAVTFRHTDPVLTLPQDRLLVLLPLCQPTEVNGAATRLSRTSSNVTVQKRLISCNELEGMLPLVSSSAGGVNAYEPESRSRSHERRRRHSSPHDSGFPVLTGVHSSPGLQI
jgi:dolichyl-phosphate beta-glucosyltransferase